MTAPISTKRVLLVDDDPIVLRIYGDGLSRLGFTVLTATDGLAALKVLRAERPDIVVLDLMMPKLSGVEVLKFMRSGSEFATLPVIVLSNAYMDPLAHDAANLGAQKGLLKIKCNPASLSVALKELLEGRLSNDREDELLAAGPSPIEPPPVPEAPSAVAAPPEALEPLQAARSDPKEQARENLRQKAQLTACTLRDLLEAFQSARAGKERELKLQDFYRKVHFLTAMAGLAEYNVLAQMGSALEALLFAMLDQLPVVTPSLQRTSAKAVEFLQTLLEEPPELPQQAFCALVVDDDKISTRATVSALQNAQVNARGTESPELALKWLQEKQYDLVMLDVEMPVMDGIELCKRLRALPNYQTTPVIYVTLHADSVTPSKGDLRGANDVISKPIFPTELAVKAIMHLLRHRLENRPVA